MPIKSIENICNANCDQKSIYPKLMKSRNSGVIVLMYSYGQGVVVNGSSRLGRMIGDVRNNWDMLVFRDYYGTITLSNT